MHEERNVYIVTREGVYRHEILGIYTSEQRAISRCIDVAIKEPDDHHTIRVSSAPLNTDIPNDVCGVFECNKIEACQQ